MRSPDWDNWVANARAVRIEDEIARRGSSSTAARLSATGLLYHAIADIRTLGRADALRLADQIVDQLITDFRRDPALPTFSYLEWQLIFDRSRARVAELIHAVTHGRAVLDEVSIAIEAALGFHD